MFINIFVLVILFKCFRNVNVDCNISLFDHFYHVYIDNNLISSSEQFTSNLKSYDKCILSWNTN